jgi:hypothetical protein
MEENNFKIKIQEELNIKVILKEKGCKHVKWTKLARNRVCWWVSVDTVMNLLVL